MAAFTLALRRFKGGANEAFNPKAAVKF